MYYVISFQLPPNHDMGAVTVHTTLADANECAYQVKGKVYRVKEDGTLHYLYSLASS